MEVSCSQKKELFFRDVERGDVVIGRITSIRDFGFFMVLISMGSGILRAIGPLEISVGIYAAVSPNSLLGQGTLLNKVYHIFLFITGIVSS